MVSVKEILDLLHKHGEKYIWKGDLEFQIERFCSLSVLKVRSITWAKTEEKIRTVPEEMLEELLIVSTYLENDELPPRGNYIFCDNPKKVFFSILASFFSAEKERRMEDDSVILTEQIGKNVSIGHRCFIGKDVVLADGVRIGNGVCIECPAVIGRSTEIHSGVIIGTDGFGYYREEAKYKKVPHYGGVRIGSEVEIGANTCIDRGTLDDTWIEDGVKIDNLCHIAHNVHIGKNSLIIACSLLGGSSKIADDGYVAPGAIIKNQISVGENTVIGMGAVVTKDIPAGKVAAGIPARIIRENDGIL